MPTPRSETRGGTTSTMRRAVLCRHPSGAPVLAPLCVCYAGADEVILPTLRSVRRSGMTSAM